jgi:sugar phosphate isomerase/epimerase
MLAGSNVRAGETGPSKPQGVGVRDAHLRHVGEPDAWRSLRAIGADAVEVVVLPTLACPNLYGPENTSHSIRTDDDVKRLADAARTNGIRVSALCMSNRFDERPDEEVEWVKSVVRVCKPLGVDAIRIDVVARRLKDDAFEKFSIEICKRVIDETKDSGVRFGIENHGRMTNNVEFLERLFDGVGSDRLGLTLDTGNFYWYGYPLADLYDIYAKFAPRTFHTHCKSIAYPDDRRNATRSMGWQYSKYTCPIYEGDINFRRVVQTLRSAGYRNALCIENESLGKVDVEERRVVLKKEVDFLRQLLA